MKNIIFLLVFLTIFNSCSQVKLAELEEQTILVHEKEYYTLMKELDINQFRGFYQIQDNETHTKLYEFICLISKSSVNANEIRIKDEFSLVLGKQLENSISKNDLFENQEIRILLSISTIPKISESQIHKEKRIQFVKKSKHPTLYMATYITPPSN